MGPGAAGGMMWNDGEGLSFSWSLDAELAPGRTSPLRGIVLQWLAWHRQGWICVCVVLAPALSATYEGSSLLPAAQVGPLHGLLPGAGLLGASPWPRCGGGPDSSDEGTCCCRAARATARMPRKRTTRKPTRTKAVSAEPTRRNPACPTCPTTCPRSSMPPWRSTKRWRRGAGGGGEEEPLPALEDPLSSTPGARVLDGNLGCGIRSLWPGLGLQWPRLPGPALPPLRKADAPLSALLPTGLLCDPPPRRARHQHAAPHRRP